jgi:hypothetical protein
MVTKCPKVQGSEKWRVISKIKVKQSCSRPGVAQRVPGS